MFGMFFLGALYMQRILGYDPVEVGLAFVPATILMGAMSFRFTARLNMRIGARATLVCGIVSVGAGLVLLTLTPIDATYASDVMPPMILIGVGAGLAFPSLMTLAMSGATPSDSGLASGLVNTSNQLGGAVGLAVLATLSTERTDGLLAAGESTAAALNSGYHLAYIIGALLVGVALVLALAVLRPEGIPDEVRVQSEVAGAEPAYSEAG
jgi:MFS family permease